MAFVAVPSTFVSDENCLDRNWGIGGGDITMKCEVKQGPLELCRRQMGAVPICLPHRLAVLDGVKLLRHNIIFLVFR